VGGAAHGAEAVDPERLVRERRVDDLEPGADAGGVREASCHGRNSTRAGYARRCELARTRIVPLRPAVRRVSGRTARRTRRPARSSLRGPRPHGGGRAPLAELTTLRIGGRPRALLECATPEAVSRAVGILDGAGVPVLVLGGGSNLVVGGGDLPMVVVAVRNRDV